MERVEDRVRAVDRSQDATNRDPRYAESQAVALPVEETLDLERFPVMVRLSEVQRQIGYLTQTVERFYQMLEHVEHRLAGGTLGVRGGLRGDDAPFAAGVTLRANPMTHPVTPISTPAERPESREDTLAGVRALFLQPRRPWWQRLPQLLRG